MTKLQKIKNKIYCSKHNLEYTEENIKKAMEKELELFGCVVKVEFGECSEGVGENQIYSQPAETVIFKLTDEEECRSGNYEISKSELKNGVRGYLEYYEDLGGAEYEILGTDLTLEDLLKSLDKETISYHVRNFSDGLLSLFNSSKVLWTIGEPLDNQPPKIS